MKAVDIMTESVVSVDPGLPVKEIAAIMLASNVSAVPVLDQSGHLVGIVSEGDLMRRPELATEKQRSWWLRLFIGEDDMAREFVKSHGLRARDVMTRNVLTVAADASVPEIVDLLEEKRIKRVPVVREGRVIGIVSRANLLRALESGTRSVPTEPSDTDRQIQLRILAELERQPWWHKRNCSIVVSEGIAHLWGTTESPEEREALRVAAEGTAGVRGVKNHINVVRPMVLIG